MSFYNSYICPHCNKYFPIFIRPSMRINRGLFAPYLKCPNCETVCQQKFDIKNAFWAWPIAIGFLVATGSVPKFSLFHNAPLLYIILVAISLLPVIVFLRRGFRLVKKEDNSIGQNAFYKWFLPLAVIFVFASIFGLVTHDWLNVAFGIIIGFSVWAFFYYYSVRKK